MRLGFIDGVGFVASIAEAPWVSLSSLGIHVQTTADAIRREDAIRAELLREGTATIEGEVVFGCPIVAPGKIIGIALNYMDAVHATGAKLPAQPIMFSKFPSALTGPRDPIVVDAALTQAVDYESELAVVIGSPLSGESASRAMSGVFGYCVANDISARDLQASDPRVTRAKSLDTFCPMGPWITSREDIVDPHKLAISSAVNDEPRQSSNTDQMIFPIPELIAFLSRGITLEPGDVILTGTPAGVGITMDPPCYLQSGDVVRCEIEQLGRIENEVMVTS
jgi:2-keto-4-pentenoate hydratase/2-oxohepta-3-ene-1,7-dioic acid hydratase in catechol pathway